MKAKLESEEEREGQAYYIEGHQVGPRYQVLPAAAS
jgi:hypothetical protein